MRTMLISLVLFCSLTQLAIAAPAPVTAGGTASTKEGCGGIYQCFVPEICIENSAAQGKPVDQGSVAEVVETSKVFADCPAIIRFYQYTGVWADVSIESYQDISKIKSIEFVQESNINADRTCTGVSCTKKITNQFSCMIDADSIVRGRSGPTPGNIKYIADKTENKLRCDFELKKNSARNQFFEGLFTDKLYFKFDTLSTMKKNILINEKAACDPSDLEFDKDGKNTSLYEKVEHTPGKYFCKDDSLYKMEYRREGSTEPYQKIDKLECNLNKFKIKDSEFEPGTKLDIRCAAETRFLCNYDVNGKDGQPAPTRVKPDVATNKPSSMKCEDKNKHLIVMGEYEEKPILNAKFECVHYGGGKTRWTIIADKYTRMLSASGPVVYCTDKVKCEQIRRIPDGSVENGLLVDFLPKCHDRGTMKVGGKEISSTKCDEKSGDYKYKYIDEDGEHLVDENTKFVCEYPMEDTVKDTVKNDQNIKKIWTTTVAVGAGLIGLAGACVGAFCLFTCWRLKRDKKRMDAYNKAAYMKYCVSKEEKAAYRTKHNLKSDISDQEPVQPWTWNAMMMWWLHRITSVLGQEDSGKYDCEGEKRKLEIQQDKKVKFPHKPSKIGKTVPNRWPSNPNIPVPPKDGFYGTGVNESNADRVAKIKKCAEKKIAQKKTQ